MKTRPVQVGDFLIGNGTFLIAAGPCSIESKEQFLRISKEVKQAGACMLRGGLFKMRTHPGAFQGMGDAGYLAAIDVKKEIGLPLVSEVTDVRQIEGLHDVVDMFQVGSRNMYNYALLKELGRARRPVLLKRGFSALIDEWVLAAQYILEAGNPNVILCERGIRTFERATRNTLDLSAVAYIKAHSGLPVLVDPSHGTGRPELIPAMCLAAAAAGADGLLIEVHDRPAEALSDGNQATSPAMLAGIASDLKKLLHALGRELYLDSDRQLQSVNS